MNPDTLFSRRGFLGTLGLSSAAAALAERRLAGREAAAQTEAVPEGHEALRVDPNPVFDLSPYL